MPHINEKLDYTVEVFIVHNNKVLLRVHDKYHFWLSVGGHIEPEETPDEAALRECKEEVGLNITLYHEKSDAPEDSREKELVRPIAVARHPINETHDHVVFVYFATSETDEVKLEKEDDQIKWFTREELDQYDIRPKIKYYAKLALDNFTI